MKLTNGDVFLAGEALGKLLKAKTELPVKCSLQVAKLANKLNEQLKIIGDVRMGLINKYEIYTEKGEIEGQFIVKTKGDEGNIQKFVTDTNELMKEEVEIVGIEKIKLPTEIDGKPLQIEPSILMGLEKFVEIE